MGVFEQLQSSSSPSSSGGGGVFGNLIEQSKKRPVRATRIEDIPSEMSAPTPHIGGYMEMDEAPRDINAELSLKARRVPVLGSLLKGLDWIGEKTEPAAEVMRSFYIPGGGLSNIAGLTQAAEAGVAKALPSLSKTVLGRIGQKAASEAIVGAPLGVAQTQMVNPDASIQDYLQGAKWGAGGGAVLGGLGKGVGEALQYGRNTAQSFARSAFDDATRPTLSLPQGRGEARLNAAAGRSNLPYGSDPIANPYTFGLPKATDETITRTKNVDDAFKSMKEIDDELTSLDSQYQQAVNDQYQLLKQQRNERGGVQQGQLLQDEYGNVIDRVGRISNNPTWYQEFYAQHGKVPSNKDLYKLAQKHVDEGYADNGIDIPSWTQENGYHETKSSLSDVREEIRNSIKEKGLNLTDAQLKDQRLKGLSKPAKQEPKINQIIKNEINKPVIQQSEPVPNVRRNFKNQQENGSFSDELNKRLSETDQTYEPITNADTVAQSNENIKDLTATETKFNANSGSKNLSAEHVTDGYRLIQELDKMGEHQRALNIAKNLAEDLTRAGQTVQAASVLARLSPEGQLLNLVRTAERNGKTVKVADKVAFEQAAKKLQENSGSGVRENQINDILNSIEKGEKVTPEDMKKVTNLLARAEKVIKPKKVKDVLPKEFNEPKKREKVVKFLDDAEQAALARIASRRNQLNSLPLNEWADHAIVVASQIAKGSIKAATHVEDLVKLFGEEIRPVATKVFQEAQKVLQSSVEKASKQVPLAEKIVEKYLKTNEKVTESDIKTLRELASNVSKLEGKNKIEADIAMQKILNSYEKSSPWDKIQAIRYISMLLNSGTQAVNAISGPIMASTGTIADIFGTMIDIAMNKTLKTPRTTTLYGTNPLRFAADWFKNTKTGGKAGWEGVNPDGIQGTNEIRGLAFKSKLNPLGIAERTLGAVAKGADYGTYKSVSDSELVKQGFLDAKNKGIKGKTEIEAHIKNFVNDAPEEAKLQAERIGKNTTFQRSDSTGGKIANYLNSAPGVLQGPIKAVAPFVRTPLNIASSAVTMTPGGIVKGLYQLISPTSKATQREAIRNLSTGIFGTVGLTSLGYYLNSIGVVTDENDSGNKDVDAIREQAGKGKYRFNTSGLSRYIKAMINGEGSEAAEAAAKYQKGDKQFDYNKLQPLAFPVAIGASLSENKDTPMLERTEKAGESAFGSLFGMSALKGLQDVFQPQYGGTLGEKALGAPTRLAESFFKSFSPSALAQEARRQDPIQRKVSFNDGIVKDVGDYFKSRTPGLSQSLPAAKTTLGQNKLNSDGITGQYLNPYKSDVAPYQDAAKLITELMDRTGDMSIAPTAPEKYVEGKDKTSKKQTRINLTPERYQQMQEEVGNEIIKKVTALDASLSDDKKIIKIKEIYSKARETARNKAKKELGIVIN